MYSKFLSIIKNKGISAYKVSKETGVSQATLTSWKNGSYVPKKVLRASVFKQFVIAQLEGVDDEDAANRLRGRVVYAAREDLPLEEGKLR